MFNNIITTFRSSVIRNSIWSVFSNIIQNLLRSIFFIVIARHYTTIDFGNYIIANTIYSFILGFSSLGMGHWFIREYVETKDKITISNQFFKMQLYLGILFYLVNIFISFILYDSVIIRSLSLIIGINIIFDNIIYVIKSLNIAEMDQKRSSFLLVIEAGLKFITALIVIFYPINIILLSLILIIIRFITLNLFIQYGTKNEIGLLKIISVKLNIIQFKKSWFVF